MNPLTRGGSHSLRTSAAGALLSLSLLPLPALPVPFIPLGGAHEAAAQQEVRGDTLQRPRESRQEMMTRIQRNYEQRMARELGLSRDQLEAVRSIMVEFRTMRGEMLRERFQLRQALDRHLSTRGTDSEARMLLDRTRALRAREIDVQRREEDRLLGVISTTQLLHFQRMRDEFSDSIRRMETRRLDSEGPPRRPGSPDPGERH